MREAKGLPTTNPLVLELFRCSCLHRQLPRFTEFVVTYGSSGRNKSKVYFNMLNGDIHAVSAVSSNLIVRNEKI